MTVFATDEVRQRKDDGAYGQKNSAHPNPLCSVVLVTIVTNDYHSNDTGDVVTADDEAGLAAAEVVPSLDGGHDAVGEATHQHGLGEDHE